MTSDNSQRLGCLPVQVIQCILYNFASFPQNNQKRHNTGLILRCQFLTMGNVACVEINECVLLCCMWSFMINSFSLTHWLMGNVVTFKVKFPNRCYGLSAWALAKLFSCECYRTPLIISQHRFTLVWLGAVRQQAFISANVEPDLCCHIVSLGDNELKCWIISYGSLPSLQRHHNELDSVSNHRHLDCLLSR